MNIKTQRLISTILSIVGICGVGLTAAASAKNTKKYINKLNKEVEAEKTKKQKVATVFKCYWPTMIIGFATAASVATGTILSKKIEASLIASCGTLYAGWQKYGNKVKEVVGKEKFDEIKKAFANDTDLPKTNKDGKQLFYEEHLGHFYATKADIYKAALHCNEALNTGYILLSNGDEINSGYTFNLSDFVKLAHIELIDVANLDEDILNMGWTNYQLSLKNASGYIGVNFTNEDDLDAKCLNLEFDVTPVFDPENYDDYINGALSRADYFQGKEDKLADAGVLDDFMYEVKA